ncbi:kunitz/BPTI-like toxin [Stomoxys calcitrans]|uniref:BPTI/Kunitz inhibitor domain-containing protein n=1 Tax=Stomoxys calcitrans TaxID=35570 RepID=A0A1I8P3F0_STOCA|nr:kunitz/BPTI-like toxin [Stomoxys calcitrans]
MFWKLPSNFVCLVAVVLLALLCLQMTPSASKPWDLYDDVSELFEAMSLDDVPGAQETAKNEPKDFCRMPARKGVCRALIPRWSYDVEKKDCVEFKFGGCDGNDNNFSSYKSCMNTCQGM